MSAKGMNFNSHPELSDANFIVAAIRVLTGDPKRGVDQTSPDFATWKQQVAANGREAWVEGIQSWAGNDDDPWFYNIPPWAWLVVIPVIAITGFALAWNAYGDRVKGVMSGNGSGSSRDRRY